MFIEKLKRLLGLMPQTPESGQSSAQDVKEEQALASAPAPQGNGQEFDFPFIAAADNKWGVDVVDIRSFTQTMMSTSKDQDCATNAISFNQEDGLAFIGQVPPLSVSIESGLAYRIEGQLADGVLFTPRKMEEKWAIFFHRQKIICVRSWTRKVALIAHTSQEKGTLRITRIDGSFDNDGADANYTERMFDFLVRSHVLSLPCPTPWPNGLDDQLFLVAVSCFSTFGNRAICCTKDRVIAKAPENPIRTNTLLHIAVARGDKNAISEHATKVSLDVLASDGLAPLHWALASKDASIVEMLIEMGSQVDVRSIQGATPLMNAVQSNLVDQVRILLTRGANVNAQDHRGFTALHRAVEMGHEEIARLLLEEGADPDADAEGHTPRSFANQPERIAIRRMMAEQS